MSLDLTGVDLREDVALFSETPSRFLVEPASGRMIDFLSFMNGAGLLPNPRPVGKVTMDPRFVVKSRRGVVIDESIADLKEAWQKTLRW